MLEQGAALLAAGRFHEALAVYGQAVQAAPLAPEPRVGVARALLGTGDGWNAAAWLSDACRVAPGRPELWLELARLLHNQQRHAELEPLLAAAVACNPENLLLLQGQAEALMHLRQYPQAVVAYRRLLALEPQPTRATLLHLGFCLEQYGDVEAAAENYRRAIGLDANFMEAHVDLAGVLWRLEDFDGALRHAQRAVELAPQHPYAVRILGTALLSLNRLAEAEVQLRKALELQPGFALAELDLAMTLLLAGRLQEGWPVYEKRWNDARLQRPSFYRPEREWQGPQKQPLDGPIVVYAEQGLGDVIQFARYIPMLQKDGAAVRCVVQPELIPLIEASFEGVECLREGREFETYYHAALLDLPLRYGTTLQTIPAAVPVPYLKAPQAKRDAWRERMAPWADRFKIGLAWSGSLVQVNNRNRAMPLSTLLPLARLPGVQAFSLQKGNAGPYTDVDSGDALVDLTAAWEDFSDSAAMLQELDLVITVDTAIAHLAGALGKPVWILLAPNADWRWLLDREDSPWYPSARLFRRGCGEGREAQAQRVALALRQRLQS